MSGQGNDRWTYDEEAKRGRHEYVIRSGDTVIGRVGSKGDADMICRFRRTTVQSATRAASDARQHRFQLQRLREEMRIVLSALQITGDALRLQRPRQVIAAREKIHRVLMMMKTRGHSI